MPLSPLIEQLMSGLRCLPGVGPKSAQRMAFHLLQRDREGGRRLAGALSEAIESVGNCARCRTLSETEFCSVCGDSRRDQSLLCVVETPADMVAVETGTDYRGGYFVLMGHLSPLDGIGPEDIGVDRLAARLDAEPVREVIVATGATVEGQATADYLGELIRARGIEVSRLAQGIPVGGELEFVDGGTLVHAMRGRTRIE